jgi:hypothetical protein
MQSIVFRCQLTAHVNSTYLVATVLSYSDQPAEGLVDDKKTASTTAAPVMVTNGPDNVVTKPDFAGFFFWLPACCTGAVRPMLHISIYERRVGVEVEVGSRRLYEDVHRPFDLWCCPVRRFPASRFPPFLPLFFFFRSSLVRLVIL